MNNNQHSPNPVFYVLNCLSRLVSLASMVAAIVVGLMYSSCNKEMSTWLIVYGFMTPIILILMLIIFCFALPGMFIASEKGPYAAAGLILLIPSVLGIIGIIIFVVSWIIYGAVLFFPAASGPFPACPNGKEGQVLVLTGTIIVAFRLAFIFFPRFFPRFTIRMVNRNWG